MIAKDGERNGPLPTTRSDDDDDDLWSEHGIRVDTKINIYRDVMLSLLLYCCETWMHGRCLMSKLEHGMILSFVCLSLCLWRCALWLNNTPTVKVSNQSINQKHLLGRQLPMNTGAVQVT